MVSKDYKPKLEPELIPARDLYGTILCPQIKVSGPCLQKLKENISDKQLSFLRGKLISQAICPEYYTFEDTPKTRKILGIPGE